MERLTEYIGDSPGIDTRKLQFYCDVGGYIVGDIARRLAAYEDKIPFDRLDEVATLVKARDEGRVVELDMPCKPLVWRDDDRDTALCPDCGKDLMGLYDGERIVLQCPECGQYLDDTKIITRAEAEAALEGGVQP